MNMNASWAPRVSPDKQKLRRNIWSSGGSDLIMNGAGKVRAENVLFEHKVCRHFIQTERVLCVLFMSTSPGVLSNFGTVLVFNTPNSDLLLLFYGHKCVFDVVSFPLQGPNYRFRSFCDVRSIKVTFVFQPWVKNVLALVLKQEPPELSYHLVSERWVTQIVFGFCIENPKKPSN